MRTLNQEMQTKLTPADALELLKQGNVRFVNNLKINRNLLQQVNETADGQYPFAFILSCIDSRTSAELIFDQGLGDVFSCRIAGNILNDDIIGSMEFSCKLAGSKIIVVLGHTRCGAVKGACDGVMLGSLTGLLQKLNPAIDAEKESIHERSSANVTFVERVAQLNVMQTLNDIPGKSPILSELVEQGQLILVGAMYNVETGVVDFFQDAMITSAKVHSGEVVEKDA